MMRPQIVWLLAAIALMVSGVDAQNANQPIYAYRNGDIWKVDPSSRSATQLTNWGYNGGPILAPDGSKIAYVSTSADFLAQFEAGNPPQTGGTAPGNIWLMDLASESFRLIADQTGASGSGIRRSLPSWSPDSQQIAWLQLDPGLQSLEAAELKLHTIASAVTSTLNAAVDLGFQADTIQLPSLRWGAGGIARLHFDYPAAGASPYLAIQFYDPSSGSMTQYDLGLSENRDNTVRDFLWVTHLGRSLMALQIQDYWDLIDPRDGARSRLSDPPRLQNRPTAGGLQLIPLSVSDGSGGWIIHWQATDGSAAYDTGYRSHRVNRNNRPALDRAGARVAWQTADRLNSWQPGAGSQTLLAAASRWAFPIPQPFGLVWAPSEWVTTGGQSSQAAPALPPEQPGCALAPLLSGGQQAMLRPGLEIRVRSQASVSAAAVGSIEGGALLNIEAGPICADGYHWYFARKDDIAGWMAEGGAGEYWLRYYLDCPNSPPIRLSATMSATVAGNRALSVRNGKGNVDTAVLTIASPGEIFTITGRPECDLSGETWYPIQLGSVLGWVAAGAGDDYYIEQA